MFKNKKIGGEKSKNRYHMKVIKTVERRISNVKQ